MGNHGECDIRWSKLYTSSDDYFTVAVRDCDFDRLPLSAWSVVRSRADELAIKVREHGFNCAGDHPANFHYETFTINVCFTSVKIMLMPKPYWRSPTSYTQ